MVVRRLKQRGVPFFTGSLSPPKLSTTANRAGESDSNHDFAFVRADDVADTEAVPPLRRPNSMGRGTFGEQATLRATFRLSERASGRPEDPSADDYDAEGAVQRLVHFGEGERELVEVASPAPADLIPVALEHRSAPAPPPAAGAAPSAAARDDAASAELSTSEAPHRLPPLPPSHTLSKGKLSLGLVPASQGREAPEFPAAARGAIGGKLALPPVGSSAKLTLLAALSEPVQDREAQESRLSKESAATATAPAADAVGDAAAPADAPPATVPPRRSSSLPPAEELPPPQQEPWQAASQASFEEMREQQAAGKLPTYDAINAFFAPTPPAPPRQ